MRYLVMTAMAAAAVAATPASAQVVINGGFESPDFPGSNNVSSVTVVPGWTVKAGTNVDYVQSPANVQAGGQSLALNGTARGGESPQSTISQQLTGLLAGASYVITFFYSGTANLTTSADVSVSSQSLALGNAGIEYGLTTGPAKSAYNGVFTASGAVQPYVQQKFTFVAGAANFLNFASLSNNNNGVYLDSVSIAAAVPEAATWAMMIIGFGAVGGALRRRRANEGTLAGNNSLAFV